MYSINKNNREEIENEFLALLLNKNELFEVTQIKPQYLFNKQNVKLFTYCKECYDEFKTINPIKILEKHKDFSFQYFSLILSYVFYYSQNWKEQLKLSEESIVKFYKEDIITMLYTKIENKEISYDEFMIKMKKLDEIQLVDNALTLTAIEMKENISVENVLINFKKYSKLNRMLELVQGDFLIIGATTGVGKSGFMLNLMNELMEKYQCIYFNMEMSKSTIYKRIASIKANITINDVIKPQTEYQQKLINDALEKIEMSKIIVEHKASDIKQIKSIVAKLKDKNKHTILFIDHLGLTRIDDKKSLYEQMTEVAKQLRQLCLENDCTIISASQLNRGAYNSDEITLSMLKDSGELENSASKVILLYKKNKDDKNSTMIVDIAKNRDGIVGKIEMHYDREKQIFTEVINYGS